MCVRGRDPGPLFASTLFFLGLVSHPGFSAWVRGVMFSVMFIEENGGVQGGTNQIEMFVRFRTGKRGGGRKHTFFPLR